MTKVQNLPPNAPKSPNSHILTWGPFGALRGPSGALGGNIVSLKPLPIKSARKNETFELSMGNTKIFLGVWRVVSMCPTLLNGVIWSYALIRFSDFVLLTLLFRLILCSEL